MECDSANERGGGWDMVSDDPAMIAWLLAWI